MDALDFGFNLKTREELLKTNLFESEIEDFSFEHFMRSSQERKLFIENFGFSVYSLEVIEELYQEILNQGNHALEVGAGSGYLSKMLELKGCSIKALEPGGSSFLNYGIKKVYKRDYRSYLEDQDIQSFKTIIMAWPPYSKDFAYKVAAKMTPEQYLIYIGEPEGGCTADSDFFKEIKKASWIRTDFKLNSKMIRFKGIHDDIYIYQKVA